MNDQNPPTSDIIPNGQEKVLLVLQICSASLSVIGSSTILFKILRDRTQNGSMMPYDRIMLGLSSCDIIASIHWATNDFLSPRETPGDVWAFGNTATCQASAFLTQLSLSSWWYNCILSFYFLLTVLSQVRRKNFVRKWEPWLHLSVIYFPITATMGLRRGWYGVQDVNGLCHVMDPLIKWIVAGIPAFSMYFILIVNNIVIYAVVRKSLRSSESGAGLTLTQKRLQREATTLMFLYVTSFFVTTLPLLVWQILETNFGYTNDDAGNLYPLLVLNNTVLPLQGFFNFFIYIKPMYTRFRADNPNKPMHFILHQALFNPNVPQLTANGITDADAANPNKVLFKANFRPHSSSSNSSSSRDLSSNTIAKGEVRISELASKEDAKEEE